MKDPVEITCYGKTETKERVEAIDLYREAVYACERHERERYMWILACLLSGDKKVSDEDI